MIRKILKTIINPINIVKFRIKNKNNDVHLTTYYPINNINVGKDSYGKLKIRSYNNKGKIFIGNYCSIADNVEFLVGGEHNYKRISTFPFQSRIYKQSTSDTPNYDIIIEDDVWIGYECLIMSNAHIGKGSVIGARSIVTGEVPPYSIYVGNKVIKQRFPNNIVNKLNDIDFSKVSHKLNDKYSKFCQNEITTENVDKIIEIFKE